MNRLTKADLDVRDLVRALLAFDALSARQWVADASRVNLRWRELACPIQVSAEELALAAGVIELLAQRAGDEPPAWTRDVGAIPKQLFLVRAAESMPRLRQSCETEGPEPLRRRGFFAPPEFLTIA